MVFCSYNKRKKVMALELFANPIGLEKFEDVAKVVNVPSLLGELTVMYAEHTAENLWTVFGRKACVGEIDASELEECKANFINFAKDYLIL